MCVILLQQSSRFSNKTWNIFDLKERVETDPACFVLALQVCEFGVCDEASSTVPHRKLVISHSDLEMSPLRSWD